MSYKCENCGRCMTECAVRHSKSKNLFDAITETPPPMARLEIVIKNDKPHMAVCQNCGKPKCKAACEYGAIHIADNGNVIVDKEYCVGCYDCTKACPFFAMFKNINEEIAISCDNCIGYDDFGCVASCPTNAIVYDEEPVSVEMCRL